VSEYKVSEGSYVVEAGTNRLSPLSGVLQVAVTVGIFFFNRSKAHDVLNHKILLFKLDAYGIKGIVNHWFKTYLCNWKQYGEIKYIYGKY
jgi:hypothetical protein